MFYVGNTFDEKANKEYKTAANAAFRKSSLPKVE